MTWFYNDNLLDESDLLGYTGFIYNITNLLNGRKYIGKKLLKFTRTKKVKGKKKKVLIDSDWKTYYSSSIELQNDVKEFGEHNFKREILKLCSSKSACNYEEARLQFLYRVLESDEWYNNYIQCRIHGSHIKGK
jgi:hypothetical protein